MSRFLRWIVSVFAEQWLLKLGGMVTGAVAAGLLFIFATDGGVPWWIALFYSVLTVALFTAIAFGISVVVERHEKPATPSPSTLQTLTQQGITVSPTINVGPFTHSQSKNQSSLQLESKEEVPPEIECTDCYFVGGILSPSNRLIADGGTPCMVAQADFHLMPIPKSDPWIELRTQFVFYGSDGTRLKRVRDGVWREQGKTIQMPLNSGDTRSLVIALEFKQEGFSTYEYAERQSSRPRFTTNGVFHSYLAPASEPLGEDSLNVQVRLIGKYMDMVRFNKDFWFSLSRPTLTISQLEPPQTSDTTLNDGPQNAKSLACPYEWSHSIIESQRIGIDRFVLITECRITNHDLLGPVPSIEFTFSIRNGSIFSLEIGDEFKGHIEFLNPDIDGKEYHLGGHILMRHRVEKCLCGNSDYLVLEQQLSREQADLISRSGESPRARFYFDRLSVAISGSDTSRGVERKWLNLKKGLHLNGHSFDLHRRH